MTCENFRSTCIEGARDAEMLEHLRSCAECLEFGVSHDPDLLFRSIGGGDIEPPGGSELFVVEVMQQIHLRETEKATTRSWAHRSRLWAAAAVLVVALAGSLFMFRPGPVETPDGAIQPPLIAAVETVEPVFVPVVERYDSDDAMIVEIPAEADDEIRIVMIFDENLPVDL